MTPTDGAQTGNIVLTVRGSRGGAHPGQPSNCIPSLAGVRPISESYLAPPIGRANILSWRAPPCSKRRRHCRCGRRLPLPPRRWAPAEMPSIAWCVGRCWHGVPPWQARRPNPAARVPVPCAGASSSSHAALRSRARVLPTASANVMCVLRRCAKRLGTVLVHLDVGYLQSNAWDGALARVATGKPAAGFPHVASPENHEVVGGNDSFGA
ncbi:hypothetical protein DAEQUDRAFT_94351 [Daedalea quercina L-15889]|uniref:Uncharacterized protein n=1 Tax=Daedalea quercina L-15889 TaxID=1314783 RepID=A0A165S9Y7_9APHY|nr:hypothetical protein DAEQUDRAFT_94351 [Daedalea quercina L-15889]